MPIYMDRHDVSEIVTAENVAQLHHEDLKIQHLFGCRGLTYWFDEKRKTAFCLVEAPDIQSIQAMHASAHGEVPNQIIEVEASIVESFLGRIEDPERSQNTELNIINDPAFRIIMVISLKCATLIKKEAAPVKELFRLFNETVNVLLKDWDGTVVKQNKNNYLVSFKSVSNAVSAALKIQDLKKDLKEDIQADEVFLKIGLSAGLPVTDKKSFFEDSIRLSQRLCELVKGNIIVSPEVVELYNSENQVALHESGKVVSLTRTDENFLTRLMDYVEMVWDDLNLRVDDFSKPIGCSKSQLYRKLMSISGKSPNTFIRDYRLNEALKLLDKNSGNISEIAFSTGFSSPSYFSRCFQKRYGILPSEYIP